jgi:hypothetical protein
MAVIRWFLLVLQILVLVCFGFWSRTAGLHPQGGSEVEGEIDHEKFRMSESDALGVFVLASSILGGKDLRCAGGARAFFLGPSLRFRVLAMSARGGGG